MKPERRFVPNGKRSMVECRGEGDDKQITGLAAVYYNSKDPDTEFQLWPGVVERIMPGAFDKVIKSNADVRGLFNHDSNFVLGRTTAGTMRLKSNKTGLDYEIDPPDTTIARDLQVSLERGDISGSSFAFTVASETWRDGEEEGSEVREINEIGELFDVGPVTYPAYSATTSGTRTDDMTEARSSHDAWIKDRDGLKTDIKCTICMDKREVEDGISPLGDGYVQNFRICPACKPKEEPKIENKPSKRHIENTIWLAKRGLKITQ